MHRKPSGPESQISLSVFIPHWLYPTTRPCQSATETVMALSVLMEFAADTKQLQSDFEVQHFHETLTFSFFLSTWSRTTIQQRHSSPLSPSYSKPNKQKHSLGLNITRHALVQQSHSLFSVAPRHLKSIIQTKLVPNI